MLTIESESTHPITVDILTTGKKVRMEVNTGAAVTILSEKIKDCLFLNIAIQQSNMKLSTYTGEGLPVLGKMPVQVKYWDQHYSLTLIVVSGTGSCLLGRNWLKHIQLDWKTMVE